MLYYDQELYTEAIKRIDNLCLEALDDCVYFANANDYDKEWVFEKFQERFRLNKRNYLKRRCEK